MDNAKRIEILKAIANDKLLYDVVTALRGPDMGYHRAGNPDKLKDVTTARLRRKIGMSTYAENSERFDAMGANVSDSTVLPEYNMFDDQWEPYRAPHANDFSFFHFMTHYDRAKEAIEVIFRDVKE